jgi:hypothetical protein
MLFSKMISSLRRSLFVFFKWNRGCVHFASQYVSRSTEDEGWFTLVWSSERICLGQRSLLSFSITVCNWLILFLYYSHLFIGGTQLASFQHHEWLKHMVQSGYLDSGNIVIWIICHGYCYILSLYKCGVCVVADSSCTNGLSFFLWNGVIYKG